jgi:hypothetical protein
MPYAINGCGTRICSGRGHIRWGGPPDFDGLECFCLLYLPLVLYRAVHTYEWQFSDWWEPRHSACCSSLTIRWSLELVGRTLLRHWLQVPLLFGVMLSFVWFAPTGWDNRVFFGGFGVLLLTVTGLCWWLLAFLDGRNRDLRRVLGPHQAGSSDPATWTEDHLDAVRSAKKLFGTTTYADAVQPLLDVGEFSRAMLAARLTVALEDAATGQALTDLILRDAQVQAAVQEVRRDQARWNRVMNSGQTMGGGQASGGRHAP